MSAHVGFDSYLSYITHQLQPTVRQVSAGENTVRRAVTISRQSGCGAHAMAERLARYLETHSSKDTTPWTIFDQNLVERVLQEHHLPEYIARFMPEDRISGINDALDELFGLHPPSRTLVEKTSETILRLAKLGHVILIGRGANVITAGLPDVLHVRLIAPLEKRIANMERFEALSHKAAAQRIQREDLGRKRYLRSYFGKELDDPLLYHVVLNTDWVTLDEAAKTVGEMVLNRAPVRIPVSVK